MEKILNEDPHNNLDYRYICGRDNYSCHNCNQDLGWKEISLIMIDRNGESVASNFTVSCNTCKSIYPQRIPLRSCQGRLIVVTGAMYSSKSTTTLSIYNKNTVFNKNRIWIKPDRDDRKDGYTETHDKTAIEATTINAKRPDQSLQSLLKYSVVVFDEVQFFHERIIYVIHQLMNHGALVIVNGLKLTAARNSFGVMPYLLAEADDIIALKSVCSICGNVDSGTRTKSFFVDIPSVSTGGMETYYITCNLCDGGVDEAQLLKGTISKK